jgi:cell division protease FtsH
MVTEYGMSERLGARKFGPGAGEVFLGRDVGHERDYSEDIASAIDDEVRRLIESSHDVAWEILVEYRDVLDELVLQLMDKETLAKEQVLRIFSPIEKRPMQKSYTGYGKRLPSDRPPVLTPKELALMGPKDVQDLAQGNGGQRSAEPAGDEHGERGQS